MDQRPGNIAVAVNGRIFVTLHPFDAPSTKMVEIKRGGEIVPFPSKEWNEPINNAGIGFVNILGIRGTPTGMIYVLDMGDDHHSPRMLEFDLARSVSGMCGIFLLMSQQINLFCRILAMIGKRGRFSLPIWGKKI